MVNDIVGNTTCCSGLWCVDCGFMVAVVVHSIDGSCSLLYGSCSSGVLVAPKWRSGALVKHDVAN